MKKSECEREATANMGTGVGAGKKTAKATLLLVMVLMAILQAEGGRDMPAKDEVYSTQSLLGLWGLPLLAWPFPFFKPPWFGGLFPWLGAPKAEAPLKNSNGQPTELAKGNGNITDQSP